jgi:prepilin-type N-terminal cleavage/methylation domain-containing protein
MHGSLTTERDLQAGFSLLEMMLATVILLVGLVFAQRELDQFVDQPLSTATFNDALGNTCNLGLATSPNIVQGNPVVVINNQTVINFGVAPQAGYSFDYADPSGTNYDVRWAVILTATGPTVSSKRFILGIRPSGDVYFQPVTVDTMVEK